MKKIYAVLLKALGVLLMVIAFLQWLTFDYPEINPFWPGAIFAPGVVSQFLNWIIVCVIGSIGWVIYSLGRPKESSGKSESMR